MKLAVFLQLKEIFRLFRIDMLGRFQGYLLILLWLYRRNLPREKTRLDIKRSYATLEKALFLSLNASCFMSWAFFPAIPI